jgi:hypothetical protein
MRISIMKSEGDNKIVWIVMSVTQMLKKLGNLITFM